MGERIDLDAADMRFAATASDRWPYSTEHVRKLALSVNDVPRLVAELRVTREIAEADRWVMESATAERVMRRKRARAAYREWCARQVQPVDNPGSETGVSHGIPPDRGR